MNITNTKSSKNQIKTYNFLMIGRSGSGKSATSKYLTNSPNIIVANSLKEVTKEPHFYKGQRQFQIGPSAADGRPSKIVKFNILDVPGLDQIENRFRIREEILRILQTQQINIHGILYVSSLTERDTKDKMKLFRFIEQLPWNKQQKKNLLIPILTKFDNLIIDSSDEEIRSIKEEYRNIFQEKGYDLAYKKRVYWVNPTKSIEFKMKAYDQIRLTLEKQVERLIEMQRRCEKMQGDKIERYILTPSEILKEIELEENYIIEKLFQMMINHEIAYKVQQQKHNVTIKIEIEPKKVQQSITALSVSSIGIFLSKVLQKQLSTIVSLTMLSIPMFMTLYNMKGSNTTLLYGKKVAQESSGFEILHTYERLCHKINVEAENQWKMFNNKLDFRVGCENLYCVLEDYREDVFKFIDLNKMRLRMLIDDEKEEKAELNNQISQKQYDETFEHKMVDQMSLLQQTQESAKYIDFVDERDYENRNKHGFGEESKTISLMGNNRLVIESSLPKKEESQLHGERVNKQSIPITKRFRTRLPQINKQTIWEPVIEIEYGIKKYDQESVLKEIQRLRQQYYEQK